MNKTFDRYASIIFLVVGALFMIESQKIKVSSLGSSVGNGIFPFGLGLLLAVLSIRLIYETFRYQETETQKKNLDYQRFGIIFATSLLYCYFLEDIGYIISTFLFLLIGFQTMKRGNIFSSLLIAGTFSVGVYYIFVVLLKISLPSSPAWLGIW